MNGHFNRNPPVRGGDGKTFEMKNGKKIGLSLSGGGYRATVYHLGTLQKLKDLGLLDKIDVLSTNSGGSITGAAYGLYGHDFETFRKIIVDGVGKSVIRRLLASARFLIPALAFACAIAAVFALLFTGFAWLSLVLLVLMVVVFLYYQYEIFPLSAIIEKIYDDFFFGGKTLCDLSAEVRIALNATNMETGRLFTFSRERMGDSSYEYPQDRGEPIDFLPGDFPVARAVAASACVPFLFSPVKISGAYYKVEKDIQRAQPRLVDGGVYDNQGLHKLTQKKGDYGCDIIIVSDAGHKLPFQNSYKNVFPLLIRVSDLFMNRISNLQMINLIYNPYIQKEVAYQSLGWDLDRSIPEFAKNLLSGFISKEVIRAHKIPEDLIAKGEKDLIIKHLEDRIGYQKLIEQENSKEELAMARGIPTNLTALSKHQIEVLVNHSGILTELNVRLNCPSLFQ